MSTTLSPMNMKSAYTKFAAVCLWLSVLPYTFAGATDNSWSIGGSQAGLSELNTKMEQAGTVFTSVVRLVLLVLFVITLIRFVKEKKWIDLLFVAISLVGLGYSQRLANALYSFGSSS